MESNPPTGPTKAWQFLTEFYTWTIILLGTLVIISALFHTNIAVLDAGFLFLLLLTLISSQFFPVRIPRTDGFLSVSETFSFVALFIYGQTPACLLPVISSLLSSKKFGVTRLKIFLFNASVAACSIFITGWVLGRTFGDYYLASMPLSVASIAIVGSAGLTHFFASSSLPAVEVALRTKQSIWSTWWHDFLVTSVSSLGGAVAAGIVAAVTYLVGLYALVMTFPFVVILYFTYQTYQRNVDFSQGQAAQAEKHVKELSHYIAEQERIVDQVMQMEKMSALGQLASGVAHNFNNALTAILGRSHLMLTYQLDPAIRKNIELVIRSADDAATTVRRIQDFARADSVENSELVNVSVLLGDVAEITRPRWHNSAQAHNVHITLGIDCDDTYVMGNASQLREVLINMIFNSIDAMPDGGTLQLTATLRGDSVVICVIDSGIGMPQEVRARVFEPFFTTKGRLGIGLGLAVSHGIIRRLHGTIEIDSEPGRGTNVRIVLPAADPSHLTQTDLIKGTITYPAEQANIAYDSVEATGKHLDAQTQSALPHQPSRLTSTTQSNIRVLVVDDEPLVMTAYRDMLLSSGYEVQAASSGNHALEIATTFCPDIVLADNNMSPLSGLQTIEELRKISPDTISILVTGYADIGIVMNALRQSVFDFLLKPVSLDHLVHSLERAVQHLETRERERRQQRFLSIVSHELLSPLQAPLRYLENILAEKTHLNQKQRTDLQRAAKGIKSEARLINNLVDLQYLASGRFSSELRTHSLRDAVQEVVESFSFQALDQRVSLIWHPPVDSFLARIDAVQIAQVVSNILNNALQHSPPNGKIKLRLFRGPRELRLMIRDQGPGIAEPYHEKIFENSFQVPTTTGKKGLGIGLYLANEIMRTHQARIILKSKLGRGSMFLLCFKTPYCM